jgi:serine-type D-Ala-D-Ala carboxypeptidase/endopeptidase (penicillin-binding protein 4)
MSIKQSIQSMSYGLVGLSLWGFAPAIAQIDPPPSQCATTLSAAIDKIIQQPALRTAYWGILVQPLKGSRPFYSKNADQLFLPASNAKLLTTAAAFTVLTAQLPRRQPVLATGQSPALNTVRIIGMGDPGFSDRDLDQLALALKAKGVQSIGTLIGDDSLFQGRRLAPSWSWEDLQGGDGLPVNSLILNGNVISAKVTPQSIGQPLKFEWLASTLPSSFGNIRNFSKTTNGSQPDLVEIDREEGRFLLHGQLRAGSAPEIIEVPVPDPGLAFLERFRAVLLTHRIRVSRLSVAETPSPQPGEALIAGVPFPSLMALATEVNQQSNNLYAETLLRLMGRTIFQPPEASTPDRGLQVLKQTLARLGVDPNGYQLADGSGLSRKNLVSPRALVETLRAIAQSPNRDAFHASLAVAGQSGTLRQRFLGTPIAGHFYGKTGTLEGTSALSGFLELPSSQPFVLSILVNHSTQSSETLRQAVEQIMGAIAQANSCS